MRCFKLEEGETGNILLKEANVFITTKVVIMRLEIMDSFQS